MSHAQAQATRPQPQEKLANNALDQTAQELEKDKKQLAALQERIKQNAFNDDALVELTAKIEDLNRSASAIADTLKTRSEQIKNRLAEIGEPPKDGQSEAAIVSDERENLTTERSQINALKADQENLSSEAQALAASLNEARRHLFTDTLFRHTELSMSMYNEAGSAFFREMAKLGSILSSWIVFVWKFKRISLFAALLLSLAATLVFAIGGYRLFGSHLSRSNAIEKPAYISRLSIAFWSTFIRTVSLAALLGTCYFLLLTFNVLRPDIEPLVASLFSVTGLVYFVVRFTNAVFAPTEPNWRLVRLSNAGARRMTAYLILITLVKGLDYLFGAVSEAVGSPVIMTVAKSFIASLVIGGIVIAASFGKFKLASDHNPEAPGRPWPRGFALIMRFLGFLIIFSALIGYVGFARFVATQLIITGGIGVTIYLGLLTGKAISREQTFRSTTAGQYLERRFDLGPIALDQIGLAAGLGIYFIVLAAGIPLILLSWGFHVQDLQILVYRLLTGFKIGNINISLSGIFFGVLLFVIAIMVTRWVQRWLDTNIMARSQIDTGVRNSVKTGMGYLGFAIAAIISISAAGIDLSSLALVASALSVGIGFGLQNIVSNFVSGLILLVERPFKVGDHIITGTSEGIVKRISVRATEIETFRKQSIIVPNSDLINGAVANWTHRNRLGRSEIPVSVSYDSDPQQVITILLELAGTFPKILKNPEPNVEFLRFGAYSLDFELRFYLSDLSDGIMIRNEMRTAILMRFREEGIKMPFPQNDITVHRVSLSKENDGKSDTTGETNFSQS